MLRQMTQSEFEIFFERTVQDYIQTISTEFGVSTEAAEKVGHEQTTKLLSAGLLTPNHFCYKVLDPENSQPVGDLWIAIITPFEVKTLFIYQIHIEEAHRGKGLARKAMQSLDQIAKNHGTSRIGLNVFNSNVTAKGLYQSLGFRATNTHMQKTVQ